MTPLQPDAFVRARTDVPATDLDGETVLLNLDSGQYHAFNPCAGRIWQLLQEGCTVGELIDRLQREFEVDAATCRADVIGFLEALQERDLLSVEAP